MLSVSKHTHNFTHAICHNAKTVKCLFLSQHAVHTHIHTCSNAESVKSLLSCLMYLSTPHHEENNSFQGKVCAVLSEALGSIRRLWFTVLYQSGRQVELLSQAIRLLTAHETVTPLSCVMLTLQREESPLKGAARPIQPQERHDVEVSVRSFCALKNQCLFR